MGGREKMKKRGNEGEKEQRKKRQGMGEWRRTGR